MAIDRAMAPVTEFGMKAVRRTIMGPLVIMVLQARRRAIMLPVEMFILETRPGAIKITPGNMAVAALAEVAPFDRIIRLL